MKKGPLAFLFRRKEKTTNDNLFQIICHIQSRMYSQGGVIFSELNIYLIINLSWCEQKILKTREMEKIEKTNNLY